MEGWADGWVDRWTDGQMEGWMPCILKCGRVAALTSQQNFTFICLYKGPRKTWLCNLKQWIGVTIIFLISP